MDGPGLTAEIASELNVGALESFTSAGDLVDFSAKGNFRSLGKRFGQRTPAVAAAIAQSDAAELAATLRSHGSARIEVDGGVDVGPDDVLISERPRAGWSVVNEQGETVALDLTLTPALVRAGLVREIVRAVQELRKQSDFDVSDRITLAWSGTGEAADVLRAHAADIAKEVLAVTVTEASEAGAGWVDDADLGLSFHVARVAVR